MKHSLFTFTLIFAFINPLCAQLRKSEHWIFVCDVTLSMCGYTQDAFKGSSCPKFKDSGTKFSQYGDSKGYYDEQYDIYDKVVEVLIERINEIENDNLGYITILPFNNRVIGEKTVRATPSGKVEICNYIKEFKNLKVTSTNIYYPLQKAMYKARENYNYRNIIILMTDGEHNVKEPTKQEFYYLLDEFCSFSEPNDAWLFYIMLTDFALRDSSIIPYLEGCKRIKTINNEGEIRLPVNVQFSGNLVYNIQDDSTQLNSQLHINVNTGGKLPADYKFKIRSEYNEYLYVDSTAQAVTDGKLQVRVRIREGKTKEDAESVFSKNYTEKLTLHIEAENEDQYVVLLNDSCEMGVANKPAKKLTIRINN